MKPLFQRMNFFKGLFTKAEDWQKEQSYHIEKRKLHNRCFHTPGVVIAKAGEGDSELRESLRVSVTPEGSITVQPGYAVDGEGRDLYLSKGEEIDIPPDIDSLKGKDEVPLFIYIAHRESRIEKRDIYPDLLQSDFAFVEESPIIRWTDQEPDNKEKIELARIGWKRGQRIKPEQIDTKHVKYAGTRQSGNVATRVQSGTAELNPTKTPQFSPDDEKFLIETFSDGKMASAGLYVANAFPVLSNEPTDARIQWRIESSITERKEVQYHLYLKNFGIKAVDVKYEVYRLSLDSGI